MDNLRISCYHEDGRYITGVSFDFVSGESEISPRNHIGNIFPKLELVTVMQDCYVRAKVPVQIFVSRV
jgi:hypothetical protein